MIICPWKDIKKYATLLPGIEEAFDAVNALTTYENGAVYQLSGGNRFFVCALTTKAPDEAEAHRKYLDIQYVVKGKEVMGWADLAACTPTVPFSEEKDIGMYSGPFHYYTIEEGNTRAYFYFYKGSDAFYFVQYACNVNNASMLEDTFYLWAQAVEVE